MLSLKERYIPNYYDSKQFAINGFNGKLISPTVDDLVDAVLWMIKKPKERVKLAENGLAVVREAFTKEKWNKSWQKEIKRVSGGLEKLES